METYNRNKYPIVAFIALKYFVVLDRINPQNIQQQPNCVLLVLVHKIIFIEKVQRYHERTGRGLNQINNEKKHSHSLTIRA